MSLQRPRRIFRSNAAYRPSGKFPRAVAVWSCGVAICAALPMLIRPAEPFDRASPLAGEIQAPASDTAVVDGETLRVVDTVVGLLGVAAPKRGQLCHSPGGDAFDCGAASAEALARLVAGHNVICHFRAHEPGGRRLAICEADGRVLNEAQVVSGWARAGLPSLDSDETKARSQHLGVWADTGDQRS